MENRDSTDFAGILDGHTESEVYDAPEDDKELAKRLKEWFSGAFDARLPYERDWELYRLYIKGDQLVVRHRDTGDIVRLSAEDSKRLRSVNNVLRPTARSVVGKLSRSIPTCTVLPATADFDEQHGARVATRFLEVLRRKERLDRKYLDINNKLPWAGNAFAQVVWDHTGGRDIAYCDTCNFYSQQSELAGITCPQCEAQRQEEMQMMQMQMQQMQMQQEQEVMAIQAGLRDDEVAFPPEETAPPQPQQMGPLPLNEEPPPLVLANEGDVKVFIRDPRDVYVDPGAESIETASVVCYRQVMTVSEARSRFPAFGSVIHSEGNLYTDRTAELRYNNVDSYGEVEYLNDHVYVYEFHEKPTPGYPSGRVIWMVNDLVVDEVESPYCKLFKRQPFFHFGFDKNDGELWYEPFMAQAWHRQREINQVETQIREHVELLLKPKFFKAIGSRITADELTATSAQVVAYNAAAGRNYFETPPPVPADVFRRNMQLAADIRMQAGITAQEHGLVTGDTSGRAMAIIEAEADQQVGPIIARNNDEWREMHRCALLLAQNFYQEDRIFTVAGPDGFQTYSFSEVNLEDGFDILVEQEDGLSRNPAVRLTQALDLMNAGVFTDPMTGITDVKSFMRHAKLNLPRAGYDSEATERAAASQIPYRIEKGEPVEPGLEDDPHMFNEELLGWLRGPGRRADPQLREQVRQVWAYYATWAHTGSPPQGGAGAANQGGAGLGGPDQSAPGGTPNSPGRVPGGGGGSIAQEAGQQISMADQAGEAQARIQQQHEG